MDGTMFDDTAKQPRVLEAGDQGHARDFAASRPSLPPYTRGIYDDIASPSKEQKRWSEWRTRRIHMD